MKKKIIIGLSAFSLLFLLSVLYFLARTDRAMAEMDNIIRLHRLELLREHLLMNIRKMQCDLLLCTTPYARSMDTVAEHVQATHSIYSTCFTCHHEAPVSARLSAIKAQINEYTDEVLHVTALSASTKVKTAAKDRAFRKGLRLVKDAEELTTQTHEKLERQTEAALAEVTRKKHTLFLLIGIVPLMGIGLSLVFSHNCTKPIKDLVAATKRIQGGDLDHRVTGLRYEFGEVATSFNDMAASLKEYCLRMQWAEQLVLLGELAGGLAHEMKNPLAGIKVSMQVLSGDPTLTAENREALLKVIEQIRRLETNLKGLLNFSKPPRRHPMPVDVLGALDAAIEVVTKHPAFSSRDGNAVVIEKQCASRLPAVLADPFHLQQAFMNLFLNAAEAMPGGGRIVVRASYDPERQAISIRVTDTGPGIPDAVKDKIFLHFFTTKPNGTGLGLTITKRLIEEHGGSISAENSPGGASFTITLPVAPGAEGDRS